MSFIYHSVLQCSQYKHHCVHKFLSVVILDKQKFILTFSNVVDN